MPRLTPVDYDPFVGDISGPKLTPVDYDPFADAEKPSETGITGSVREVGEAAGKGIMHGLTGLAESVGTGLEYAGEKLGSKKIGTLGKETSSYWAEKGRGYEAPESIQGSIVEKPELLKSPSWWAYHVADTVPSFAASIAPGVGAYKYLKTAGQTLKFTPQLIERLAKIGAGVAGGGVGGALEGTGTYQEVIRRGGTPEDAAGAAEMMTLASAGLNAISVGKMAGVAKKGLVGKAAKHLTSGAVEGVTEFAEEPAEGLILGESPQQIKERMKQGVNVIPPSMLLGVGGSVAFDAGAKGTVETEPKLTPVEYDPFKKTSPARTEELLAKVEKGERLSPVENQELNALLSEGTTTPEAQEFPESGNINIQNVPEEVIQRDQEDIAGVSGEVGKRQGPVETEPVESAGGEASRPGRVLQAQKGQVTESPVTLEQLQQTPSLADFILKREEIHSPEVIAEAKRIKEVIPSEGQRERENADDAERQGQELREIIPAQQPTQGPVSEGPSLSNVAVPASTVLPALNNNALLEGRPYNNWQEFLDKEGTLVEEIHGHKFYNTTGNYLRAIVGPDGSIMAGNPQIMEAAMADLRESNGKEFEIQGGMWEPIAETTPAPPVKESLTTEKKPLNMQEFKEKAGAQEERMREAQKGQGEMFEQPKIEIGKGIFISTGDEARKILREMFPEGSITIKGERMPFEKLSDRDALKAVEVYKSPLAPPTAKTLSITEKKTPLQEFTEKILQTKAKSGKLNEGEINEQGISRKTQRRDVEGFLGAARDVAERSAGTTQKESTSELPSFEEIKAREVPALKEWAGENDLLIPSVEFTRKWKEQGALRGGEHQLVYNTKTVIKRKEIFANETYSDFLKRLEYHNRIEPAAKYNLLGFSEVPIGEGDKRLMPILEQPIIKGRPATQQEIEAHASALGLKKIAQGKYLDIETGAMLSDLEGNESGPNAIVRRGKVIFIDPQIDFVNPKEFKSAIPEYQQPVTTETKFSTETKSLVGKHIQIGKSPQTWTIVRELEQSDTEKELGERYFEIKNDRTGEAQTVERKDIRGHGKLSLSVGEATELDRILDETGSIDLSVLIPKRPLDRLMQLPFRAIGGIDPKTGQWKIGKVAYDKAWKVLSEKNTGYERLDNVLEKIRRGLIDKHKLPKDYVSYKFRKNIEQQVIMEEGMDFARAIAEMPIAARKVMNDILQSKDINPGNLAKLSEPIRQQIIIHGKELVDLGLLPQESYEKHLGSYLHRSYLKYMEQRSPFEWVTRKVRLFGSEFKRRKDLSKEVRQKLGELEDAAFNVAETYRLISNDLATGRLYDRIAKNPALASSEQVEGWVQVPRDAIPGTALTGKRGSGVMKFGNLAGMWLDPEVYNDLVMTHKYAQPSTWKTILTQWKISKTIRNPTVHINNMISNFHLVDMADVPMTTFVQGLYDMKKKTDIYKLAQTNGIFGQGFYGIEIQKMLNPALELAAKQNNPLLMAWEIVRRGDNYMKRLYQVEDDIFRMAVFKDRIDKGLTPDEAAQEAKEWLIDYDISAEWIQKARNSVLPFSSYPYRALGRIAKTAATKPWKLAKYYALYMSINALSSALGGGGDDERKERAVMPEYGKGKTWFGSEKMIKMPFKDAFGQPLYFDISRKVPGADIFDTTEKGALPFPIVFSLGGPLDIAFSLYKNRDSFTGKDITSKTDTAGEVAGKVADYLYKQYMPNNPIMPFSYSQQKIVDAFKGRPDAIGRQYSVPSAIASTVGFKTTPIDVPKMRVIEARKIEAEIHKVQGDIFKLNLDRSRNRVDEDDYNEQMKNNKNKILKSAQRIRDLMQATE